MQVLPVHTPIAAYDIGGPALEWRSDERGSLIITDWTGRIVSSYPAGAWLDVEDVSHLWRPVSPLWSKHSPLGVFAP
jgi:hypothetical protein